MKGLFKGLRYISQIFDAKDEEMQIGYPTDVKHVAHIGWDGPSVNAPSWMNEFRSAPLSALAAEALAEQSQAQVPVDDTNCTAGDVTQSRHRELLDQPVSKPRRQSSASSAVGDSPTRSPAVPRHPRRRNKSATSIPVDSATVEQTTSSRRHASSLEEGNSTPTHSPARDLPSIPRVARKKKTKAGGGVASAGSSKSGRVAKAQAPPIESGEAVDRSGENALAITSSPERSEDV